MKRMKFIKDAILIAGIAVVMIAIAETALSLIFPTKVTVSNPFEPLAYEFHKDYLISIKPNIEKKYVRKKANGGQVIHWKTNSDSFRGAELKENPDYRIIVYGDSNVQARFSERENTYPVRLQHHLEQAGISGIEVVNAGIVGLGPDQNLLRFSKEVDRYHPDMVIFHVFADNDFGDLLRNQLFSLDEKGALLPTTLENKPGEYFTNSQRERFKAFSREMLLIRLVKRILGLSKADRHENKKDPFFLWYNDRDSRDSMLQELCDTDYTLYQEHSSRESIFGDYYDMDIALNPEAESSKTKIELMEAVLKEAHNLAQIKGVRFLVLIQPAVIDMTRDNSLLSYEYLKKYPHYKRTNLTDAVEKVCMENEIPSVNLFTTFEENAPDNLFFKGENNHWNDRGQDLAAQETARYFKRSQ